MYRVDDRGSEIELTIDEVDAEGLFTEALMSLGDVFSGASAARGAPVSREVRLDSRDLPGLLGDWLSELIRLAEEEAFVPERIAKLRIAGNSLQATLAGERDLPRELIDPVVPDGVTVARLDDATWEAVALLHRTGGERGSLT